MAAIAFPNIEPTTRKYNPGEFPRTLFESQNGSMTAVYFGDRPVNGTLEMTFRNIRDNLAHDIINHYKRCNRADDRWQLELRHDAQHSHQARWLGLGILR